MENKNKNLTELELKENYNKVNSLNNDLKKLPLTKITRDLIDNELTRLRLERKNGIGLEILTEIDSYNVNKETGEIYAEYDGFHYESEKFNHTKIINEILRYVKEQQNNKK